MERGYARYRAIGTKQMRLRDIRIVPIDEHHCLAHVAWTATYAREDQPDMSIDFDVHYLVQKLDGEAKVFGRSGRWSDDNPARRERFLRLVRE